jgi:hypothetical protein
MKQKDGDRRAIVDQALMLKRERNQSKAKWGVQQSIKEEQ